MALVERGHFFYLINFDPTFYYFQKQLLCGCGLPSWSEDNPRGLVYYFDLVYTNFHLVSITQEALKWQIIRPVQFQLPELNVIWEILFPNSNSSFFCDNISNIKLGAWLLRGRLYFPYSLCATYSHMTELKPVGCEKWHCGIRWQRKMHAIFICFFFLLLDD